MVQLTLFIFECSAHVLCHRLLMTQNMDELLRGFHKLSESPL